MSSPAPYALSAILYSRQDCPLCDEMKREIERAGVPDLELSMVDIDVEGDGELRDRYGWRVPVLEVEGEVLAEGRCEAVRVAERIARLRSQQSTARAEKRPEEQTEERTGERTGGDV